MIILTEKGQIVNLDNHDCVDFQKGSGDKWDVLAYPAGYYLGIADDEDHARAIIEGIFIEWYLVRGVKFKEIADEYRESLAKDRQRVKFMADDLDDETLKDLLHEEFVEVAESVIAGWSELKRAQARQWGQAEYGKDFDATIEVPEMPKFLEEYAT